MVKGSTHLCISKLQDVGIWKHTRLVLALTLIFFSGCHARTARNGEKPTEIVVAAAANLTDAFPELSRRFSDRTGIRVVLSFGGTADLAKQIENGAPFDVFAAADTAHVEALEQKGLLTPGTRVLYARGSLVLWVPAGSTINIERVEYLQRKEVERIAIAKPDIAPYGQAAVEVLRALKMWDQVEPKVVYGMNVLQVKQFVSSGNAEAGFLPRAVVRPGEGKYIEISEHLHQPIDQALAVVKASANQIAARRFADFVLSPEGQLILKEFGYKPPTPVIAAQLQNRGADRAPQARGPQRRSAARVEVRSPLGVVEATGSRPRHGPGPSLTPATV